MKAGALRRHIKWDGRLTIEYLRELFEIQGRRCPISGVELYFSNTVLESAHGNDTASLDRIDSSGEYEIGNVHWTHKIVNVMKQSLSTPELVEWCRKIVVYNDRSISPPFSKIPTARDRP